MDMLHRTTGQALGSPAAQELLMAMLQRRTLHTCGVRLAFVLAAVDGRHAVIFSVFLFFINMRWIFWWQGRGGTVGLTPYTLQEAGGRICGCHANIGLHELAIMVGVVNTG